MIKSFTYFVTFFFLSIALFANPFIGDWKTRTPCFYHEGKISYCGGQHYLFKEDGIVEITTKSWATGKESWIALKYDISNEWITIGSNLYWYMILPDTDILLFHVGKAFEIKDSKYGESIEIAGIEFFVREERLSAYPLFFDER